MTKIEKLMAIVLIALVVFGISFYNAEAQRYEVYNDQ